MFENESESELLRRYNQQDLLAGAVRTGLSLLGPVGAIAAEFITEFVPQQRLDRLHDFVEKLGARLVGLEEQFKTRLASDAGFAALTEQATLSAVRAASGQHRSDLAELLKQGLSHSEAEMLEEQALLSLRDRINDAQVLLLMSHGSFEQTFRNEERAEFQKAHPGVFGIRPTTYGSSPDERRRWTMREHYERELAAYGLLKDTEGIAKSGAVRRYEITSLGLLLLKAIGRDRDQKRT